ncbi:MAG: Folylpolyglutamate synthetase [Icmadophila ericetorum]|nr:Folylpolyglutamate synthetase [Icmadophila ericetorum]
MGRTYSDAIAALNTLQSNFSIVDAIRKAGKSMNKAAIPEMIEWCRRLGYEPSDFDRLKPIHIAGTKGKGSTSAFISSILAQYIKPEDLSASPIRKVGLYTSPHLRFVRERIQINNSPLSEEVFAKYFFETWDRFEATARRNGQLADTSAKPIYFRFLTLMAMHTYLSEGVDVAIIECGIGGEYDSTNIITGPSVTAITSLGIDHTAMLGNTIEEIAWHKAGIMKSPASAFTALQPPTALVILQERAHEKNVDLKAVERHPQINDIELGLAADFQKTNASLAIEVAAAHLRNIGFSEISTNPLPAEFIRGLENVKWGGRCETRRDGDITWYLDGGHTIESITVAGEWFASCCQSLVSATSSIKTATASASQPTRILLFNQQTRNAPALLRTLHTLLSTSLKTPTPLSHALFCTNITFRDSGYKPDLVSMNTSKEEVDALSVQRGLKGAWEGMVGSGGEGTSGGTKEGEEIEGGAEQGMEGGEKGGSAAQAEIFGTIEDAVNRCREIQRSGGGNVQVLCTGSVHLVGGVMEVLESQGVHEGGKG